MEKPATSDMDCGEAESLCGSPDIHWKLDTVVGILLLEAL